MKHLSSLIERRTNSVAKASDQVAQNYNNSLPAGEGKVFCGVSESKNRFKNSFKTIDSWNTIIKALSKLCLQRKKRIFFQSTVILFEILKVNGEQFPREFWKRILHETMKPLLEGTDGNMIVRKTSISLVRDESSRDNEPLREIFSRIVDLHNYFRPKLDFFTKDMFEFLVDCGKSSNEILAKVSVNTIRFIVNHFHAEFAPSEWEILLLAFKEIFDKTLPRQLMTYKGNFSDPKQVIYFHKNPFKTVGTKIKRRIQFQLSGMFDPLCYTTPNDCSCEGHSGRTRKLLQ